MLSVAIITRNEERNIRACIKSVEWADEIIVVDSESEDRTKAEADHPKVKFYTKPWAGFAAQRQFGLDQTTGDWIFVLDADERATDELKNEIFELINNPMAQSDGYWIPRKSFFLGQWIREMGWYPGYQLRLFKKSKVKVVDRLVHEGYEVQGETGKIKNDILHYTISSIEDFTNKVNRVAVLQAKEMVDRKRVTYFDILIRPLLTFIRHFIFKKGYKDGIAGLMVAYFDAMTNGLTYMNIWEIQHNKTAANK
jgi:glycosyltransferase involved in cell wall biosynthesis